MQGLLAQVEAEDLWHQGAPAPVLAFLSFLHQLEDRRSGRAEQVAHRTDRLEQVVVEVLDREETVEQAERLQTLSQEPTVVQGQTTQALVEVEVAGDQAAQEPAMQEELADVAVLVT